MKKSLVFLIGIIAVFGFIGCNEKEVEALQPKDGVYPGQSKSFPGASVEVTVLKGRITGIEVVKAGGNPDYYSKAVDKIPGEIIKKQSVDVDAVTGATKTSVCIKEAVTDALNKAAR